MLFIWRDEEGLPVEYVSENVAGLSGLKCVKDILGYDSEGIQKRLFDIGKNNRKI